MENKKRKKDPKKRPLGKGGVRRKEKRFLSSHHLSHQKNNRRSPHQHKQKSTCHQDRSERHFYLHRFSVAEKGDKKQNAKSADHECKSKIGEKVIRKPKTHHSKKQHIPESEGFKSVDFVGNKENDQPDQKSQ